MHCFEVYSNESVCRKSGCLGLDQVSGGLGEKHFNVRLKNSQNSVADNTVPETVVLHTLSQALVLLARGMRRLLVPLRSRNRPLSLVSFAAPGLYFRHVCFP